MQAAGASDIEAEDAAEAAHALRVAEALAAECPGISLLVGRVGLGKEPILRVCRGFADLSAGREVRPDTIFRIFSLTKPIVSASMLPLIQSGQVRVEDPIAKWLPEFETSKLSVWQGSCGAGTLVPAERPILLIDVLRHTSGQFYPANPDNGTPGVEDSFLCDAFLRSQVRQATSSAEFSRRLAQVPLAHQPGSRFTYSPATALIPVIVEQVTGKPYDKYLQEVLLGPLGMTDTGFFFRDEEQRRRLANLYVRRRAGADEPQTGFQFEEAPRKIFTYEAGSPINGDGGLFSTVEDYAKFAQFLLSAEPPILGPSTQDLLDTFLQDHLAPDLSMPEDFLGFPSGFGLGTYTNCSRICGWSGLANTHFWLDRQSGRYVLLMAQSFPFSWRYQRDLTARARGALQPG